MSLEQDAEVEPPASSTQDVEMAQNPPVRSTHKSFKKKYRKIMITFGDKIEESNTIYGDMKRMEDISRRLAEQNDQILELLYDLNASPEITPDFRYDLSTTGKPKDVPEETTMAYDIPTAHAALTEARQELRNGELSPVEYRRLEESILRSGAFAPARSYLPLLSVPHRPATAEDVNASDTDSNAGFVSTQHEDFYKQELDDFLAGDATNRRQSSYSTLLKSNDRAVERDRDAALHNPVSVYNWLRKHQPQVFLQDKENEGDKTTSRSSNARGSKRVRDDMKSEVDMYDEEGIALEPKASARGKRKRDDDGGYRPKGGSNRSAKRKREDGGSRRSSKKTETPG